MIDKAPFKITTLLTDNGKEFTDRFCAAGERQPTGSHAVDQVCADNHIEHPLTKPRTPQTNGMIERFNGRIADVLRTHRDSAASLQATLKRFVYLYNHYITQKNLRHKTPLQTLQHWYAQQPQLFIKIPRNHTGHDTASVFIDYMQNTPAASDSLSLVIPMYEEADNVAPILARVHKGLREYTGPWELICVDDGSRDGTGERLREQAANYGNHVRIIDLRRNFGQTAAMQAGLDAARGSLIATLDGDLQNDPADIPRMVRELVERDLDLLQGWRLERRDGLLLRKIPSRIANRLIAQVTGVHLHDYGCSLKLYRAEVIKPVRLFGEMHRLIPVWVAGVTDSRRIGETVVRHEARRFGTSKYGISRTFRVLPDLLAASFFLRYGTRPGHFFGAIGMGLGLIGTLIMAHLLVVKFGLGEDIGNRPLLFVGTLFLVAAIQFLTTGVLAEILARTFFASRDRPNFIIARQSDPDRAGWRRSA